MKKRTSIGPDRNSFLVQGIRSRYDLPDIKRPTSSLPRYNSFGMIMPTGNGASSTVYSRAERSATPVEQAPVVPESLIGRLMECPECLNKSSTLWQVFDQYQDIIFRLTPWVGVRERASFEIFKQALVDGPGAYRDALLALEGQTTTSPIWESMKQEMKRAIK